MVPQSRCRRRCNRRSAGTSARYQDPCERGVRENGVLIARRDKPGMIVVELTRDAVRPGMGKPTWAGMRLHWRSQCRSDVYEISTEGCAMSSSMNCSSSESSMTVSSLPRDWRPASGRGSVRRLDSKYPMTLPPNGKGAGPVGFALRALRHRTLIQPQLCATNLDGPAPGL